MKIITYQQALDQYSANDTAIYNALIFHMNELGDEVVFNKNDEFWLDNTEESVTGIRYIPSLAGDVASLNIDTENDKDGETNEYSLEGDDISQNDKMQLLSILERLLSEKRSAEPPKPEPPKPEPPNRALDWMQEYLKDC